MEKTKNENNKNLVLLTAAAAVLLVISPAIKFLLGVQSRTNLALVSKRKHWRSATTLFRLCYYQHPDRCCFDLAG